MSSEYRVVHKTLPFFGPVLQCAVQVHGRWVAIGPMGDTVEELRAEIEAMLEAFERPVIEPPEVE